MLRKRQRAGVWLHVCAGFLGLFAAFSVVVDINGTQRTWAANLFGLGDILIVATTLSLVLLDELTPYHNMMFAVFLPTPLWLLAHCLSIWKLLVSSSISL
ncbi:MAG: hypothetical protein K0U68_02235 [Gammaproteobacteria bacterium]|nr:hypothetical protein [Gammaproteobacteria bacterium]